MRLCSCLCPLFRVCVRCVRMVVYVRVCSLRACACARVVVCFVLRAVLAQPCSLSALCFEDQIKKNKTTKKKKLHKAKVVL